MKAGIGIGAGDKFHSVVGIDFSLKWLFSDLSHVRVKGSHVALRSVGMIPFDDER
jgi:hypothetical protein